MTAAQIRSALHEEASELVGAKTDYDPLLSAIGNARFVLLGEASHGTHEFYGERAEITKRLIAEKGFGAVAVEADWPDAQRVNRFVGGSPEIVDAEDALAGFQRFPTWMWRNADVLDFVGWLRAHNEARPETDRVGFCGLDLYSLHASMNAVLTYLDRVDPEAAARARRRYACFDHFGTNAQAYGYATESGMAEPCEGEVVRQLVELRRRAADYAGRDGRVRREEFFFAEQNARLVRNAEEYYRAMFRGRVSSWNLRDRHMAETLEAVVGFLQNERRSARIVVWAHNSHLGDALATEMGRIGELNLGQLVRERHGAEAFLVGFTTDHGTVTAASDWDGPAERKRVRRALPGSYEALFHEAGQPRFLVVFARSPRTAEALSETRLERAIGVIYLPETERVSHYFYARMPAQFDAVLHFDETRAVEPLERVATAAVEEVPETFPSTL